jgi:PAS domain S-box-containing protein
MLLNMDKAPGKILIVDDEESIRFTFRSFLEDEGHEVDTASTFDEALELILGKAYDLVFADIILGGKTGIDLLREMKRGNRDCPVVMITGYPNINTASEAVRLGAFDYISKPVKPDTLLHTANLALRHKALQDENERFRSNLEAVFRSVKDGIITIDQNETIMEINQAAERICGFDRNVLGRRIGDLDMKCRARCFDVVRKTLTTQQTAEALRMECGIPGSLRKVVSASAAPLLDSHASPYGAVLVVRDETRLNDLERNLLQRKNFCAMIGENERMQKIYAMIEDLADVQTTVLITGESGTGKELVAEAIHYSGDRSEAPLVKVNCSALSENLLESELFGHVRGAFTGAVSDKVGRFQKANGGTIFLDEIGDISQRMQIRLLRVLQEKIFERVGDSSPIKVDVRVIAATNRDLLRKVKRGEFREDLYFRLRVVELHLPPLRERLDDIPLLVQHFIEKFNAKFGKNIEAVSDEVTRIFMNHRWPGNVRELEHAMEHAFIVCHQNTITAEHLPPDLIDLARGANIIEATNSELDEAAIREALQRAGGNKSKAARILGVNVRTIYRKIEKYNINPDEF